MSKTTKEVSLKDKRDSLERLINRYYNATGSEEKMLLKIIQRIDPSFKGKR